MSELISEKNKIINNINSLADEISEIRKENGLKLEKQFSSQAESVGLKGSSLKIKIDEIEPSINGKDEVDFLFTANPDQNPKSILKVASGGELSRIMLILRGFIMDKDSGSLLIFDEADSGIGGVVAETIGKKIKTLSENNQVICITHLAQVAKFADNHFLVTKKIDNETTKVSIKTLTIEGQIQELSRMMAGKSVSENTLEVAKEMLINS